MNLDELASYIRRSGQQVLIEAEAKSGKMNKFIAEHNAKYGRSVTINDESIRVLHNYADKWSLQLRIYFEHIDDMPKEFGALAKDNNTFYPEIYTYKINGAEIVEGLFERGFHIGEN